VIEGLCQGLGSVLGAGFGLGSGLVVGFRFWVWACCKWAVCWESSRISACAARAFWQMSYSACQTGQYSACQAHPTGLSVCLAAAALAVSAWQ
jgi:hypothetical protein